MKLKQTSNETFNLLHDVYRKDNRDLKVLSQNDVRGCFKAQKARMEQCAGSDGYHFEGDNM
jgi:hypothetical protein